MFPTPNEWQESYLEEDWSGFELADGRYQLTHRLGRGGMASIYHAIDRRLKSEVVIKVPEEHMVSVPALRERFAREIRALSELTHPHVARIIDVGEHDSRPFAVLDYLPGGSLEDRLYPEIDLEGHPPSSARRLPLDSLSLWLRDIASALDFLHAKAMVHRDVKPGNILFDESDNAYLADFGVAKVLGELSHLQNSVGLTRVGSTVGTLHYMAPEAAVDGSYSGRVDQYALAVTVYLALTGHHPFEGEDLTSLVYRQAAGRLEPIHALRPNVPPQLSAAVSKGLSNDPADRFDSCRQFADAVLGPLERPTPSVNNQIPLDQKPSVSFPTNLSSHAVRYELRALAANLGIEFSSPDPQTVVLWLTNLLPWYRRLWDRREVCIEVQLQAAQGSLKVNRVHAEVQWSKHRPSAQELKSYESLLTEIRRLLGTEQSESYHTLAETESGQQGSTDDSGTNVNLVTVITDDRPEGYLCWAVKLEPNSMWLISDHSIPVGEAVVRFEVDGRLTSGKVARCLKREGGAYAVGVGFRRHPTYPEVLRQMLQANEA